MFINSLRRDILWHIASRCGKRSRRQPRPQKNNNKNKQTNKKQKKYKKSENFWSNSINAPLDRYQKKIVYTGFPRKEIRHDYFLLARLLPFSDAVSMKPRKKMEFPKKKEERNTIWANRTIDLQSLQSWGTDRRFAKARTHGWKQNQERNRLDTTCGHETVPHTKIRHHLPAWNRPTHKD